MSLENLRIAVVASRFNTDITQSLLDGALRCSEEKGLEKDQVETFWVPGAFELPSAAKKLALTGRYDAIVCLGVVLKGETYHFEYVSSACATGICQAALDTNIPILFGVLTAYRMHAEVRAKGERNKGFHTFKAALEMIELYSTIDPKAENILH